MCSCNGRYIPLVREGGRQNPAHSLPSMYLNEIEQILAAVMYEGHENGVYRYRNRLTRRCITLDSRGRLVSMEPFALDYYY